MRTTLGFIKHTRHEQNQQETTASEAEPSEEPEPSLLLRSSPGVGSFVCGTDESQNRLELAPLTVVN